MRACTVNTSTHTSTWERGGVKYALYSPAQSYCDVQQHRSVPLEPPSRSCPPLLFAFNNFFLQCHLCRHMEALIASHSACDLTSDPPPGDHSCSHGGDAVRGRLCPGNGTDPSPSANPKQAVPRSALFLHYFFLLTGSLACWILFFSSLCFIFFFCHFSLTLDAGEDL